MKKLLVILLLLFTYGCTQNSTNETTIMTSTFVETTSVLTTTEETTTLNQINSDIFGLSEPSLNPELFAPDIISRPDTLEFAGTFSPDFRYYFFTRRNSSGVNRIFYTEYVDGSWTNPELSPISEDVAEFEPFITPDGRYLYFGSQRDGHTSFVIYRSEYISGVWQEAVYLENELNDDFSMYISVSLNGNIYYTATDGIRMMEYSDGDYLPSVLTGISGAHPYIAPDESYMLFDNSGGPVTYPSIFITRNVDGVWQTPVKLGSDINLNSATQICASVSPDGKYLFFGRFSGAEIDIYWLSADYLDAY